jgi:hypothetical protein
LGGSPFNIRGYTECLMAHAKRRITIITARIRKQSTKKNRCTNAQKVFFSDTKKGTKENVTEKVEEKTWKEKMVEKRKVRNTYKSTGITEN